MKNDNAINVDLFEERAREELEKGFTEAEILFLGKMDLIRLGEKFPYAAEYYMMITE